jgi:hypothetical protein
LSTTISACNEEVQPHAKLQIGSALYEWPEGTVVLSPASSAGRRYVRYRSSKRYPDPDAYLLIYDSEYEHDRAESGLPYIDYIVSRFDKREDFDVRSTPVGDVICRRNISKDLALPCGLVFAHRDARWRLKFGAHLVNNAERLHRAAVQVLENLRREV